jgi:nitroimidazol reductase NimA-like FMN-containing flavoprotein (pyridoxamine 5'-phosphate oxidase superfamily)
MAEVHPSAARPYASGAGAQIPWAEARQRIEEAQFYWLATTCPDGRPHAVPVLAISLDGTMHFCTGRKSRKGRNLSRDTRCVLTVDSDDLHLVLEGDARRVTDETRLQHVADLYGSKYGWDVTVEDGAIRGDGAPTAGSPPYDVYAVTPSTVFGFGTDDTFGATRWCF